MPTVNVLVTTFLEPEYVAQIRGVRGVRVVYDAALVPQPRYRCDHVGRPLVRPPDDEARWRRHLADAEVMFDFDYTNLHELAALIPNVKWIQATSTGIGQTLVRSGLIETPILFTTARGIHGKPLADFAVLAILWFAKEGFRMVRDQAARRWTRYCGRDTTGATVALVGFGSINQEVGRLCKALGMRVLATRRTVGTGETHGAADRLAPTGALLDILREADYVVLATPHTPETEGLIGREALAAMKPGAVLINVARGAVVDEPAMIEALRAGHLGGAALDVFAKEPLSPDSPLWDMPNVLVSPHSASTVDSENARLTDLFCENLGRYLRGEPLLNVFDRQRLY